MQRWMLLTSATALLLSGCAACSDCIPPMVVGRGYCAAHDHCVTARTARGCARRDFYQMYKDSKPSKYFAEGFSDAYVDVALGKRCAVPPVPPPTYWNAFYRSCAGADAVQDWFDGYAAGLDASKYRGVSGFNRVRSSWTNGCSDGTVSGPVGPLP